MLNSAYRDVVDAGEVGLPLEHRPSGRRLVDPLLLHVGVEVDEALDPRLVVQVRESGLARLVLHSRRLGLLPRLAREVLLHIQTSCVLIFFSRNINECVVPRNLVR